MSTADNFIMKTVLVEVQPVVVTSRIVTSFVKDHETPWDQ